MSLANAAHAPSSPGSEAELDAVGGHLRSRSSTSRPHDLDNTDAQKSIADRASQPGNFTIRGLVCGLLIGIVVVFSNTYFGLQTGWISGMAMPAALLSFALFRALDPLLRLKFSPMENVFIQSVSGSVGTMPLGCGFVGVVPALEYLLKKEENGPLNLSTGRLVIWAIGICLFGVVFAVPLRRGVIIREKLKFPSGTATALMISILHGGKDDAKLISQDENSTDEHVGSRGGEGRLSADDEALRPRPSHDSTLDRVRSSGLDTGGGGGGGGIADWKTNIRIMGLAFAASGAYTIFTYFAPGVRNLPILGMTLAQDWLWTLNPSPAYVGQGIIMGPETTAHMMLGAIIGWAILSPLAKTKGWAPGPVSDWTTGSKGWLIWVSLAIMLADALVSLGWLVWRPLIRQARILLPTAWRHIRRGEWHALGKAFQPSPASQGYAPVDTGDNATAPDASKSATDANDDDDAEADAPASQLISRRTFLISLGVSVALYFVSVQVAFPGLINIGLTLAALILAFFLSILGVRALGETDLNPVSGISKLTQLVFAVLVPARHNPNAVTINLLAGAISESGALQAGDLMQDLKAGHLIGASPAAQFWGQVVGSVVGAAVSAVVYKLYAQVYEIPSREFQVPTAYVWVFTARLVTGDGLPSMAAQAGLVFGGVWAFLTLLRSAWRGRAWTRFVPGGIAVAVGMYNTPNFAIARAAGGLVAWWWTRWKGRDEATVVVLASGLILGEGLFSIVNLGLAAAGVPHLPDWGDG